MKVLAADTRQLLKATGSQTGQLIAQMRADAQKSLKDATAHVADLPNVLLAKTRGAAWAADDYVRANPWEVMGSAALAGLVLGFLLVREKDSNSLHLASRAFEAAGTHSSDSDSTFLIGLGIPIPAKNKHSNRQPE